MLTLSDTDNTINTVNTERRGLMFLINLQGKDSIFEQIRSQIEKFIETGILKPNDKLPSVRTLAGDLGINPNTVMKAYQELEKNGYIYTVNKKGAFVCKDIDTRKNETREDAVNMIRVLKQEGYTKKELHEVIDQIYKEEDNA